MDTGIYIHIPFCLTKCGYCSFFSVPYSRPKINRYYEYLLKEISLWKEQHHFQAKTIYFGGGTPSLLPTRDVQNLIQRLNPADQAEITLEVNPIQITEDFLLGLKQTEVNRLSLGMQSALHENLQLLGRKHPASSLPQKIKLCRKYGYHNLSFDFMYGLPAVPLKKVKEDLEKLLALKPKHVSTYLLTLDEQVPFAAWKPKLPSDLMIEKQYELIRRMLQEYGFRQYEISNFARTGYQSKHNLAYWLSENYLGLGAGAAGYLRPYRYQHPPDIRIWEAGIDEGALPLTSRDSFAEQKTDFIIMQLRLRRGLDRAEYRQRFGTEIFADYRQIIAQYQNSGYLKLTPRYLKLSDQALLVSNHILKDFV